VQRVSDTVAILNEGELIAQAPIAELLAGSRGTVYAVEVRGEADAARARLESQPWVVDVQVAPDTDGSEWHVSVSDASAAEEQMLRVMLADEHTTVTRFGPLAYKLEDVFMDLVEGNGNGN
jgi:ABC-type uncharacterized transport system ATPase subunit